jgi:hypothetical protein
MRWAAWAGAVFLLAAAQEDSRRPALLWKLDIGSERKIGEQVGGLPARMREVISLTREGFDYAEIAKEVERAYSTIKAEFWQAIEQLRIAVQGSGILFPPKPLPAFTYPNSSVPSRRALRKLITELPIEYPS